MSARRLPDEPVRTAVLVAASSPKLHRPRMRTELEDMMHNNDRERAACYASMEDLSDRMVGLADQIDSGPVSIDFDSADDWTEDSLVVSIAVARTLTE